MPNRPLRPCAGGCGAYVARGRCSSCGVETRQTSVQRGYGRLWKAFRPRFFAMLVQLGILPVCGAALPGGPSMEDSHCKQAGYLTYFSSNGSSLHLDHDPPLDDWERAKPERVCDPLRVGLLCDVCHASKTRREQPFARSTTLGSSEAVQG